MENENSPFRANEEEDAISQAAKHITDAAGNTYKVVHGLPEPSELLKQNTAVIFDDPLIVTKVNEATRQAIVSIAAASALIVANGNPLAADKLINQIAKDELSRIDRAMFAQTNLSLFATAVARFLIEVMGLSFPHSKNLVDKVSISLGEDVRNHFIMISAQNTALEEKTRRAHETRIWEPDDEGTNNDRTGAGDESSKA